MIGLEVQKDKFTAKCNDMAHCRVKTPNPLQLIETSNLPESGILLQETEIALNTAVFCAKQGGMFEYFSKVFFGQYFPFF